MKADAELSEPPRCPKKRYTLEKKYIWFGVCQFEISGETANQRGLNRRKFWVRNINFRAMSMQGIADLGGTDGNSQRDRQFEKKTKRVGLGSKRRRSVSK